MISISDNTAANHLLYTLGRSTVEVGAPARLRPFLATREVFDIKWAMSESDRAAYLAATPERKAAILSRIGPLDEKLRVATETPTLIESVEWFITTRELCQVIYELRDVPVVSINPALGLVDKAAWSLVGFKSGAEPGVLNYTHVLRKTAGGHVYAVSATINNPTKLVDTDKGFTALVTRLISLIEKGGL